MGVDVNTGEPTLSSVDKDVVLDVEMGDADELHSELELG